MSKKNDRRHDARKRRIATRLVALTPLLTLPASTVLLSFGGSG